jgi:DNA-binding transcriptional LysR family regulator
MFAIKVSVTATVNNRTLNERDLRALRIFRVAAQAGGFSAAERQLNMSKATISRQIKDVEDRLGARLCTRGPQGFELTAAGVAALRFAEVALDALDRILPEVDATRGVISGKLILGLTDNVIGNPESRIHLALQNLQAVAPTIDLAVQTMTTNEMIRALLDRRVDIAIKGVYEKNPSLEYLDLFEETHRLYWLPAQSANPRQLPLVFRAVQPFVEDALTRLGFTRGPEAIGLESVATLIATGHYVGLLPTHYARMLPARLGLQEVPDSPTYRVMFSAVTNPLRPLPRAAEKLLELLERETRASLGEPQTSAQRVPGPDSVCSIPG